MFHHLAHLLGHFCQFPISPGRTGQRLEQHRSKSKEMGPATLMYIAWILCRFSLFKLSVSEVRSQVGCECPQIVVYLLSLFIGLCSANVANRRLNGHLWLHCHLLSVGFPFPTPQLFKLGTETVVRLWEIGFSLIGI